MDTGRIDEARFIPLGGIEQWVTIRGENRSNPILLHVHGGPGVAFSAFTDEFAPYEADFTIVQWDQRGAGRTFGRYGADTPEVTLDRIARDGIELAAKLQDRLGKRKIIVFGHSLGSIVATEMVRRAPEHFAAYVATGQFASFKGTVDAQLRYLREIAEATDDTDLITRLDEIERLAPEGLDQFFAINRLLSSRLPAADAAFTQSLQSRMSESMTPAELEDWQAGTQASVDWLMPDVGRVDLFATTQRFNVPFIVIQGSEDIYTPTELAAAYFEHVEAPTKELVIVEGAGHFPHLTHSEQFLATLVRITRPLTL
jgi:pimeloyl-ACP methyl ester carboxylesterase